MKSSFKIAFIYLIVGLAWIIGSDQIIAYFGDGSSTTHAIIFREIIKGSAYIFVTAVLLFFLIRYYFQKVSQSQAAYRKLFEENPCPMFCYDRDTMKFLAVNEASVHKYGFTREELLNMTVDQIHPPEDERAFYEIIRSGKVNENPEAVWRHRTKKGDILYVNVSAQPARINGKNARWVLVRDITEVKKNEILLKEAVERFDLTAKATNNIIWDYNIITGKIIVNESFQRILGYEEPTLTRYRMMQKTHPQDSQRVLRHLKRVIAASERVWEEEFRIQAQDNSYKFISIKAFISYNTHKKAVRITGAAENVTESKKNDRLLKAALERYDLTIKATSNVIWEWNADTGKAMLYGALEENFGYHSHGIDINWFNQKIHPEDYGRVWKGIREAIATRSAHWIDQYRLLCADGTYKYVYGRGYIIYKDKRPDRSIGVIQVIQKQKEYELKIENQNRLLKEIAQTVSHELRGPVASIKGLINLIEQNKSTGRSHDNDQVLQYICISAMQLDKVIHEIMEKANQVYGDPDDRKNPPVC